MKQIHFFCNALALFFTTLFFTVEQSWSVDYSDPTWPCIQRKVESLSPNIMWPYPIPKILSKDDMSKDWSKLAKQLSLRRFSLKETEHLIAQSAAKYPDVTRDVLGWTFKRVFDDINKRRSNIIGGIARYSLKQISLSKKINETRIRKAGLVKTENPDFDKIDSLEEQLAWDERIYKDRSKSVSYVCETPVLLEKRLYAIAQQLLKYAHQK